MSRPIEIDGNLANNVRINFICTFCRIYTLLLGHLKWKETTAVSTRERIVGLDNPHVIKTLIKCSPTTSCKVYRSIWTYGEFIKKHIREHIENFKLPLAFLHSFRATFLRKV